MTDIFPVQITKYTKDAALFWRMFNLMREGLPQQNAVEQAKREVALALEGRGG